MISHSTSIDPIIVSVTIFEIFDVQFWWPRISIVQGHPRSKVMVPIGSSGAVPYSASIDLIVVSVIFFEILDIKVIFSIRCRPKKWAKPEVSWRACTMTRVKHRKMKILTLILLLYTELWQDTGDLIWHNWACLLWNAATETVAVKSSARTLRRLGRQPRVVFLYGPPTNCYVAYTDIRHKIVFTCRASYAVYTVITHKIRFMYTCLLYTSPSPRD